MLRTYVFEVKYVNENQNRGSKILANEKNVYLRNKWTKIKTGWAKSKIKYAEWNKIQFG